MLPNFSILKTRQKNTPILNFLNFITCKTRKTMIIKTLDGWEVCEYFLCKYSYCNILCNKFKYEFLRKVSHFISSIKKLIKNLCCCLQCFLKQIFKTETIDISNQSLKVIRSIQSDFNIIYYHIFSYLTRHKFDNVRKQFLTLWRSF